MLLGNRNLKNKIVLDSDIIELTKELKYLGVIFDKNLNFKKHLEFLDKKTNNLIMRMNSLNYLKSDIEIRYKKRIYFSVFLPMILYSSRIWYNRIKSKVTYLNKLRIIQMKFIKSITGMYRCTKSEIIYRLLNIIDIVDDLEINSTLNLVDIDKRKEIKNIKRNQILVQFSEVINTVNLDLDNIDYDGIKHRFSLWCLSGTGPFKSFLHKIGRSLDNYCRFCHCENETSSYSLLFCNRYLDKNFDTFEKKCIYIVNDLFKNSSLINC
jgi:hypothetical protein